MSFSNGWNTTSEHDDFFAIYGCFSKTDVFPIGVLSTYNFSFWAISIFFHRTLPPFLVFLFRSFTPSLSPFLLSYKSSTRLWPALTAILYPPPSSCLYGAAPLPHHHPISNLSSTAGNPTVSRNLPATERLISQLIYRRPEPCAMPRPSSGALYAGYVKLFSFQ